MHETLDCYWKIYIQICVLVLMYDTAYDQEKSYSFKFCTALIPQDLEVLNKDLYAETSH